MVDITLMTTYDAWLSGRGFSRDTIRARTRLYRSRLKAWETLDQPAEVIAEWLRGYSGWTRRTYQNHLASIYQWLVDEGELDTSPIANLKNAPTPRHNPKPLPSDQKLEVTHSANHRTRSFLLLGWLAGLRAFEIAKFHGIDITRERIHVVGKGGNVWDLPTHPALWELAQAYPRDGFWFPPQHGRTDHIRSAMVTASVGRLFRKHGIDGAVHRARHTYATELRQNGVDFKVIQELMRHRSLATTAYYLGTDDHELVSAIGGLAA